MLVNELFIVEFHEFADFLLISNLYSILIGSRLLSKNCRKIVKLCLELLKIPFIIDDCSKAKLNSSFSQMSEISDIQYSSH